MDTTDRAGILAQAKKCRGCGALLLLEAFGLNRWTADGRKLRCRPCESARRRSYRDANPAIRVKERAAAKKWSLAPKNKERRRIWSKEWSKLPKVRARVRGYLLRKKYGISSADADARLATQGGVCAICRGPHGLKGWFVDHNHKANLARGILCSCCNAMIGMARERVETLEAGIAYLKRWSEMPLKT